jgi:tetratricopeptide (TPR) repeat protein
MQQGRLAEAATQFGALLQASPDNLPARLNLGAVRLAQGQWQEAAAEYRQALGEGGGEAEEKLGLIALNYQQDPAAALAHFDRALERRTQPLLLVWRGVALRQLQRPAEAEMAYRQALRLDPGCIDAWYNLGNLFAEQGDGARAVEAYRQAAQRDPESELGRRALRLAGEEEKTLRP